MILVKRNSKNKISKRDYNKALLIIQKFDNQEKEVSTTKKKINYLNLVNQKGLRITEVKLLDLYFKERTILTVDLSRVSKSTLRRINFVDLYNVKGVGKATINKILDYFESINVYDTKPKKNREKIFTEIEAEQKIILENQKIEKLIAQEKTQQLNEEKRQEETKKRSELEAERKQAKELKIKERQESKDKKNKEREELRLQKERVKAEKMAKYKAEKDVRNNVIKNKTVFVEEPIYQELDEKGNRLNYFINAHLSPKTVIILTQYFELYKGVSINPDIVTRAELSEINMYKFIKTANFSKSIVNNMVNFLNAQNIPTTHKVNNSGKLVMIN